MNCFQTAPRAVVRMGTLRDGILLNRDEWLRCCLDWITSIAHSLAAYVFVQRCVLRRCNGPILRSAVDWEMCWYLGPDAHGARQFGTWLHNDDNNLMPRMQWCWSCRAIASHFSTLRSTIAALSGLFSSACATGSIIKGPSRLIQEIKGKFRSVAMWSCHRHHDVNRHASLVSASVEIQASRPSPMNAKR